MKTPLLKSAWMACLIAGAATAQTAAPPGARWAELSRGLAKRITVNAEDLPLRAAASLLQSAEVPVRVAPDVDRNLQVTLNVRDVPLQTVLAMVARPLGLSLAPDEGVGVIIKNWPRVSVGDTQQTFRAQNAPWTDDWPEGVLSGERLQPGGAATVVFGGGLQAGGVVAGGAGAPGGLRYIIPQGPPMGLTQPAFTAVGDDQLLVTEATHEGRQPGWRVTLYVARRDGLRRGNSFFHEMQLPPGSPPPPPPGLGPGAGAEAHPDECGEGVEPPAAVGIACGEPSSVRRMAQQAPAPRVPGTKGPAPLGLERSSVMLYPYPAPPHLEMIALGSSRVVAVEPASSNGRAGWKLTLIVIEGNDVRSAGSLFHESPPPRPFVDRLPMIGGPEGRRPQPGGAPGSPPRPTRRRPGGLFARPAPPR